MVERSDDIRATGTPTEFSVLDIFFRCSFFLLLFNLLLFVASMGFDRPGERGTEKDCW